MLSEQQRRVKKILTDQVKDLMDNKEIQGYHISTDPINTNKLDITIILNPVVQTELNLDTTTT